MTRIKVVTVRGNCQAGFEVGDTFTLSGLQIVAGNNQKSCLVAFASIVANVSRCKFQESAIYISCPDPATGTGGNVIFEVVTKEDNDAR